MDTGDKLDYFTNVLENNRISSDDRELGISMEDYYGGSFLLAWERSHDKCNSFCLHIMEWVSIDVIIKTTTKTYKYCCSNYICQLL